MNDAGVSKRPANSRTRGLRSLRGLFLMLITMESLLGIGKGVLIVLNDSMTTFLECKGA